MEHENQINQMSEDDLLYLFSDVIESSEIIAGCSKGMVDCGSYCDYSSSCGGGSFSYSY